MNITLNTPIYIVGEFFDTQREFRSMHLGNVVRNIKYNSLPYWDISDLCYSHRSQYLLHKRVEALHI